MGSPFSPTVANLYMEAFETSVLEEYGGIKPKLWLRFVDDTFVILDKRAGEDFFRFINNKDPNIKFTQEACIDNKIAFLDCLVSICENGSLKTEVYRKPTHTDHYLRFDSNHPLVHKLGVIRTLFHRGDTIISDPNLVPKERKHIKQSLRKCGYPGWAFRKASKKRPEPEPEPQAGTSEYRRTVGVVAMIPYVAGVSERIKNSLKTHSINTIFKPIEKLRGKLVRLKDRTPREKKSNLVYGIPCGSGQCNETYVGETTQSLKARMRQHQHPNNSSPAQTSAVYLHHLDTGHTFNMDEVIILDREEDWVRRGIKEAVWERVEKPSLNRKGGLRYNLSSTWDRALSQIPRRLSRDQVRSCDKQ